MVSAIRTRAQARPAEVAERRLVDLACPPPAQLVRFRTFASRAAGGNDETEVQNLLRGRLRFKDITTFNDPFEARPHHVARHSDAARQRAAMIEYLASILPGESSLSAKRKIVEKRMRGKSQQEIVEHLSNALATRDRAGEAFVFCLMHPETVHTPLPWSHYADSHRGVCIHFDTTTLPIRLAIPVTYGDDYPTITIPRTSYEEDLTQTLLRKASGWNYEREWRVIQIRNEYAGASRGLFVPWEGDTAIVPPRAVQAITVGSLMSNETTARLVAWIEGNAPHVEVWRAELSRTSYWLDRRRVA